ncbi:MAG TPA: hypothetical protein VNQ78_17870 [Paracoccus sp. (in: a-proteobacteria)]|uniref:hypothetical protein n=1 Tax=Paracoccus sp. TaxID=267 RepID=UPI002B8DEEC3|nr:hypothetical protein [Paracoccus sp. (in: a-proteobacteria)]HWL58529.1 hypothetical protein [Paracoccus sp. (in: a-proteobacteria)]
MTDRKTSEAPAIGGLVLLSGGAMETGQCVDGFCALPATPQDAEDPPAPAPAPEKRA